MVPQNHFQILNYSLSKPELQLWYHKAISEAYTRVFPYQNYNYGTKPFPNPKLWSLQTRIKIMVPQNYFWESYTMLSQTRIIIMVSQNYFQALHYGLYRPELILWCHKTILEAYTMVPYLRVLGTTSCKVTVWNL